MAYYEHSNFVDILQTLRQLGVTTNQASNAITELQQYLYDQTGSPTLTKTEASKQNSDLEIFPRIVMSEEFRNLKINN